MIIFSLQYFVNVWVGNGVRGMSTFLHLNQILSILDNQKLMINKAILWAELPVFLISVKYISLNYRYLVCSI